MADGDETSKEAAKAVQEVAKATGKAVDAGSSIGGFLNRIFGCAIEDTVGVYWTDKIKAKRIEAAIYDWERLESLVVKARKRLEEKGGLDIRSIPPKVALSLIEHATVEHEDDLHTLWANLMATGMDAREQEIQKKFVSTLGEMTSSDSQVMLKMYKDSKKDLANKEVEDSTLIYGPGIDGTYSYDPISVITLNRLGLIEPSYTKFKTYEPGGHDWYRGDYGPTREVVSVPGDLSAVTITPFGLAFAQAVGLDNEDTATE